MSPPAGASTKPRLSESILENNNVFIGRGYPSTFWLPDWLLPVCEHVRHQRRKIPRNAKGLFTDSLEIFLDSGHDSIEAFECEWYLEPVSGDDERSVSENLIDDHSFTMLKSEIHDCARVSLLATQLRKRQVQEEDWRGSVYAKVFRTYDEMYFESDEYRDLFERWTLHADVSWNECDNELRTAPKPDLTYAFPIINDTTSKIAAVYRFDRDVENFTLSVLGSLRSRPEDNVISSPKRSLERFASKKPEALGDTDLTCFPWAIVEFKTSPWKTDSTEYCHFQAANASAEALVMREKLANRINHPSKDALVIFSFTCVGPSVRLWLTYRDDTTSGKIWMRCIWATSLEVTWGVFALRMVIDNIRNWVYRRVKPEIARWIHLVRLQPEPGNLLSPDSDRGIQRRRAVSHEPQSEKLPVTPPESSNHSSRSKCTSSLSGQDRKPTSLSFHVLSLEMQHCSILERLDSQESSSHPPTRVANASSQQSGFGQGKSNKQSRSGQGGFGQEKTNEQSGGLFGGSFGKHTSSTFGKANQQGGFGQGKTNEQSGGLFGGSFGKHTSSTFGKTNQQGGSLFGQHTSSTFGKATQQGVGLFGQGKNNQQSGFGLPSIFGKTVSADLDSQQSASHSSTKGAKATNQQGEDLIRLAIR